MFKRKRIFSKNENFLKFKIFLIFLFCLIFNTQNLLAKGGKWEIGVHYSSWDMNFIWELLQYPAENTFEKEFRNEISNKYPNLNELNYNQEINFESSGNNYGFELRFYPSGKKGSFSIGFSIDKIKMRLLMNGKVKEEFTNGSYIDLETNGNLIIESLSYNLSFRWDIKPSWKIRPYFTIGLGIAPINGEVSYSGSGEFFDMNEKKTKPESLKGEQDLKNTKEFLPIIPIIQLNLGIKGEIINGFYILIDFGIWNGFLLRGGIAFRI
jgi:hypothetical protein